MHWTKFLTDKAASPISRDENKTKIFKQTNSRNIFGFAHIFFISCLKRINRNIKNMCFFRHFFSLMKCWRGKRQTRLHFFQDHEKNLWQKKPPRGIEFDGKKMQMRHSFGSPTSIRINLVWLNTKDTHTHTHSFINLAGIVLIHKECVQRSFVLFFLSLLNICQNSVYLWFSLPLAIYFILL